MYIQTPAIIHLALFIASASHGHILKNRPPREKNTAEINMKITDFAGFPDSTVITSDLSYLIICHFLIKFHSILQNQYKTEKPQKNPCLLKTRTLILLLLIKSRVDRIEVSAVESFCCKTQALAEALIVYDLPFAQEAYNVVYIRVI